MVFEPIAEQMEVNMPIKIAMIGAGSIGFTRRLMHDILAVPELQDTTFAFMDISQPNVDMVTQLCERDIRANRLPAQIVPTLDRRAAIADADYIICTIRQGGLEAFTLDVEIPLKYGVDQCVGDTLCAGGLMYAQRTIPAMLDICKDIREVAKPDALFLNYSNPMAMNTWACNQYGGVKTVGLCHGVQGAHEQIADCIERWAKREGRIARQDRDDGRCRYYLRRDQPPDLVHPGGVARRGHDPQDAGVVRDAPGVLLLRRVDRHRRRLGAIPDRVVLRGPRQGCPRVIGW
jgi:hypothetical protein